MIDSFTLAPRGREVLVGKVKAIYLLHPDHNLGAVQRSTKGMITVHDTYVANNVSVIEIVGERRPATNSTFLVVIHS